MPPTRVAAAIGALLISTTACTTPSMAAPTPTNPTTAAMTPQETLTPLLEQPLPNVDGKTFTSVLVDFPPGARATPHRHGDAFVYAYALNGAVRSQLDEQPPTTYHQGDNWVELPGTHHVLTKNPSQTEPAKLLVVFIAPTGAPFKSNDPH